MHDVNWWLMALSFLIGLALTFLLMIRKVTREVPVTRTVSAAVTTAAAGAATAAAGAAAAKLTAPVEKVVAAEVVADKVVAEKVVAAEVVADKPAIIKNVLEHDPFGEGSIRVTSRFAAPTGYVIKGDKDTGRYFTVESPDYGDVEAEVWFADEESAKKAGFLRWNDAAGVVSGAAATLVSAGAAKAGAPAGWTIKGNADSMLYHTVESPWYKQTIAEVWFPDEEAARQAGFRRWDSNKGAGVASIADVPAGPYGKGSAKAAADGSGPAGWLIKGNADSMLYHGSDSPAYSETIAEVWFFDEATAKAAGFDKWDKNFK